MERATELNLRFRSYPQNLGKGSASIQISQLVKFVSVRPSVNLDRDERFRQSQSLITSQKISEWINTLKTKYKRTEDCLKLQTKLTTH